MSNRKHLRYNTLMPRVESYGISLQSLLNYNTCVLHQAAMYATGFAFARDLIFHLYKSCCTKFFREFSLPSLATYEHMDLCEFRSYLCTVISNYLHAFRLVSYYKVNYTPYTLFCDTLRSSFHFKVKGDDGVKFLYNEILLHGFVSTCNSLDIPVVQLFSRNLNVKYPKEYVDNLLKEYKIYIYCK